MSSSYDYDTCLAKYNLLKESLAYAEETLESLKSKESAGVDLSAEVYEDLIADAISCLVPLGDDEQDLGQWIDDIEADWIDSYDNGAGQSSEGEDVLPPELEAFYTNDTIETMAKMAQLLVGDAVDDLTTASNDDAEMEEDDLEEDEDDTLEIELTPETLASFIKFFKVAYVDRGQLMLDRLKAEA